MKIIEFAAGEEDLFPLLYDAFTVGGSTVSGLIEIRKAVKVLDALEGASEIITDGLKHPPGREPRRLKPGSSVQLEDADCAFLQSTVSKVRFTPASARKALALLEKIEAL